MTAPFSVIIPAHNEASVIERCLRALLAVPAGEPPPEIAVVCNGCSDATAEIARRAAPDAQVIELEQGSKPLAINTGNAALSVYPRFVVDADVSVSWEALREVARVLASDPQVMAAAPRLHVDLTGCSRAVRGYYRVWQRTPYVRQGMVGSGIFGLSREGWEKVGEIPPIIADDYYVRTRFAADQRRSVTTGQDGRTVSFTVYPPRNLATLIRIESRRRVGEMQLHQTDLGGFTGRSTTGSSLRQALGDGVGVVDLGWYVLVKLIGRAWAKRQLRSRKPIAWKRDDSSR